MLCLKKSKNKATVFKVKTIRLLTERIDFVGGCAVYVREYKEFTIKQFNKMLKSENNGGLSHVKRNQSKRKLSCK